MKIKKRLIFFVINFPLTYLVYIIFFSILFPHFNYGQFPFLLRNSMIKSNIFFEFRNIVEFNYHLINHKQWIELVYRPSFIFGNVPIGFGFQFPISIDYSLKIRKIDYQNNFTSIISKLDFFQYGYENQTAFLLLAPLESITFEDHFILSNYQNNLIEYEYRNLGLFFRLDLKGIKGELIVSNFITQHLIGNHLQIKLGELILLENQEEEEQQQSPNFHSNYEYLKAIKLGFISANDLKPKDSLKIKIFTPIDYEIETHLYKRTNDINSVNILSFYLKGPLFLFEKFFQIHFNIHYGTLINIPDNQGMNFNLQFYSSIFDSTFEIDYSIQFYYLFKSGFIPQYFNRFHEILHDEKFDTLFLEKKDWGIGIFLSNNFLEKKIVLEINYTELFPTIPKRNYLDLKFKINQIIPNLNIIFVYSIVNFQLKEDFDFKESIKNYAQFEIIYGFNRFFHLGARFMKGISLFEEKRGSILKKGSLDFSIFTKISF